MVYYNYTIFGCCDCLKKEDEYKYPQINNLTEFVKNMISLFFNLENISFRYAKFLEGNGNVVDGFLQFDC